MSCYWHRRFLAAVNWEVEDTPRTCRTGMPHIQGAIFLKRKMRWSQFGLPKEVWGEVPASYTSGLASWCE